MLLRYFLNDSEMVPAASLLLVSLLFLHFTCAVFLLQGLYTLESSRLLLLLLLYRHRRHRRPDIRYDPYSRVATTFQTTRMKKHLSKYA